MNGWNDTPTHTSYDVVIIGGAMYGSSVAWWLTQMDGFDGRVCVIERDPTYEFTSTAHTNSCIRQQFSNETNIQISQFGVEFIKNHRAFHGGDARVPDILLQSYGYMYLADTETFAQDLREGQAIQAKLGAGTQHMSAEEIAQAYPFYNMSDIIAGNHNLKDEGYFDGNSIFDWWKRGAREQGVEYVVGQVDALEQSGGCVTTVCLADGTRLAGGLVVNCAGPRAAEISAMIGQDLPVAPRRRYTFIFDAAEPLEQDLPLTIDPSGVHMRTDGQYYLAGCGPMSPDVDIAPDDFAAEPDIWEEKVWPILAHRVPAFERIKLINQWVGHYAYNSFDQNAVVGPHPDVSNFIYVNGFSGHGFQQSPAIGRGVAEWITYGAYRSIDLTPFAFDRIPKGRPFVEKAVI